jgi:hypothetical protein
MLYGFETWYFILREECRLRAFENDTEANMSTKEGCKSGVEKALL